MQLFGDLEDLESALGGANLTHVIGSGSCSALVKLLPGNADLFVSHDNWGDYNAMLRVFKRYELNYMSTSEKGNSDSCVFFLLIVQLYTCSYLSTNAMAVFFIYCRTLFLRGGDICVHDKREVSAAVILPGRFMLLSLLLRN